MMSCQAPLPKYSVFQRIKLLKLGIPKWIIPTYTTSDELFKLYDLARSLKTTSIGVEIGSYIGGSSLMIGKGLNNESKLYCIDTWENQAMTEGYWDSYQTFLNNTKSVKDRIIPIRSNSMDASNNLKESIDYLFIDADHSYEGVKADVDAWFDKLKPGGIIIMHDIGWAEGVIKVVEENVKPYLKRFDQMPNMFWGWKK